MPVNDEMMARLKKEFGTDRGEKAYYALEKIREKHKKSMAKLKKMQNEGKK